MQKIISSLFMLMAAILSGCHTEEPARMGPRLDYYMEYFDLQDLSFQAQLKVQYYYQSDGKLSKYVVSGYNPTTGVLEEQRHFTFLYNGQQVATIQGFLVSDAVNPYIQYQYHYLSDGRVSSIEEKNLAAGVNSTATFTYDTNNKVKVVYAYSNGAGFEYEFDFTNNNIVSDKTSRGTEICSNGTYTFDQHVNPFAKLGYVDYTLTNLSVNNKLTEDVSYISCAFPSLIPQSYTYEYNSYGYPTVATTHYKAGGSMGTSMRKYYYIQRAL